MQRKIPQIQFSDLRYGKTYYFRLIDVMNYEKPPSDIRFHWRYIIFKAVSMLDYTDLRTLHGDLYALYVSEYSFFDAWWRTRESKKVRFTEQFDAVVGFCRKSKKILELKNPKVITSDTIINEDNFKEFIG